MSYATDPRVDAYIDALPEWQRRICREVRDLVHAVDPEVAETIKRTNRPYFVLQGNICALLAAKDHVNVFLYDGAIVPDPERIITAGHENKTARTVAVRRGEVINAPAHGDVQAHHCQQPCRRLAQAEGRRLIHDDLDQEERMAIVVLSDTPNMTSEQYDEVAAEAGLRSALPDGCQTYIAG